MCLKIELFRIKKMKSVYHIVKTYTIECVCFVSYIIDLTKSKFVDIK